MKNSKLIELISSLSKSEFREFSIYVKSQSQKEKKRELNLLNFLKRYYPDFSSKQFTKENCFKKVFPGDTIFNQKRVTDTMSDLYLILEDFVVSQELKQQHLDRNHLLLKAFQSRKLDKLFLKKFEQIDKELDEGSVKDNEYFFNKFWVNKFAYDHSYRDVIFSEKEQEQYFQTLINSLDEFYFITKLIFQIEFHNRSKFASNSYTNKFDDYIFDYVQNETNLKHPIYQILSKFILGLKNKNYADYHEVKSFLFKNIHFFGEQNKQDLFNLSMNYCLQAHYTGYIPIKEILDLYKIGIELNLLTQAGYIPQAHFNNIVSIACQLKDFNWVENFIETKIHLLNQQVQKDMYALSKATIYFHKGEFTKTLSALNEVEIIDEMYKITGKSLQLRAYYELNEFMAIDSLFLSLKQSVRRNKKKGEDFKTNYNNFIDITKKMLKLKSMKKQRKDILKEVEKLKTEEEQTEGLFFRLWIKAKLKEFV